MPVTWVDGVTPVNAANLEIMEADTLAAATAAALKVDMDEVAAAGVRIIQNKLAGGDTQPAFKILGDGRIDWGPGGATALDTYLARVGPNALYTPGALTVAGVLSILSIYAGSAAAGQPILQARASGDTQNRFNLGNDGLHTWGSGALAGDTTLYRMGAGQLRTAGLFVADQAIYSRYGAAGGLGFAYNPASLLVGSAAFYSALLADAQPMFVIRGDGKQEWGPGGSTVVDTNLYRSGADSLRTDDQFAAAGQIVSMAGVAAQIVLATDGRIYFGTAADTNLYRAAADILKTDDGFIVTGQLNPIGVVVLGAASYIYSGGGAPGSAAVIISRGSGDADNRFGLNNDGKMLWGNGTLPADTNLYRSAADTLKTDDSLEVGGTLKVGGVAVTPGSGGMTLIADALLAADAANFDLTSIPQTYKHLKLVLSLRSNQAGATDYATVRFNGDATALYTSLLTGWVQTAAFNGYDPAVTKGRVGLIPGNTGTDAGTFGSTEVLIPDFANAAKKKNYSSLSGVTWANSVNNSSALSLSGFWSALAAINRITILPNAGGLFLAGSRVSLYGLA